MGKTTEPPTEYQTLARSMIALRTTRARRGKGERTEKVIVEIVRRQDEYITLRITPTETLQLDGDELARLIKEPRQ